MVVGNILLAVGLVPQPLAGEVGNERLFRFVRLSEVEAFLAQGWEVADSFAGTHHGHWSLLMELPALVPAPGPERPIEDGAGRTARMYVSTKTYGHSVGLSCCFRQWRADSHCRFLHGYALAVKFEFEADDLDARHWVVDFGSLKSLKAWLEDLLDHKTLVATDDPKLPLFRLMADGGLIQLREVPATGCEGIASIIFGATEVWLVDNGYAPRVRLRSVEVREHEGNSAMVMA